MPRVPASNVIPMRPQAPQVEPTYLAMAAAMLHAEGKFQPVMEKDAIARYGRPNVQAGIPTKDRLKATEREMELEQRKSDALTDENKPIADKSVGYGI